MGRPSFTKRFSFPYRQLTKEDFSFYHLLANASQEYRDEICDIYFSSPWKSEDGKVTYGDVMGGSSPKAHDKYILKIQNELGVNMSLTFNEMNPDKSITHPRYLPEFIEHVRWWYDRGIRSCTISNTHLMGLGVLQHEFPEMTWKNTVNHIVKSAQLVLDYHMLGYNTILLDRELNRDWDELRKIRKLQEKYNFKTSLLVKEGCAPNCLFKTEHDTMGADPKFNYWSNHGQISCAKWRLGQYNLLPRMGTDIIIADQDRFDELCGLVDILKYSGRMSSLPSIGETMEGRNLRFGVGSFGHFEKNHGVELFADQHNKDEIATYNCFREAYEHDMVSPADLIISVILDRPVEINPDYKTNHPWKISRKHKSLAKVLETCKNQCYECHACERVFGVQDFDSYIEINRDMPTIQKDVEVKVNIYKKEQIL